MEFSPKKNQVLGVFSLVMINVIAIDSLRNLPANAVNGVSLVFLYCLAAVVFLIPCLLITAELATHHPKSGGVYVWTREAFGPRWGLMTIWLQWIYNVFWYPTILSFIAVNLAYLFHPAWAGQKIFLIPTVIGMFLVATLLNARGMRISSQVSIVSAIVGTLVPMLAIIVLGLMWLFSGKPLVIDTHLSNWLPSIKSMPNISFLVIILFSLMGFEMSAAHAEAVENPARNFPKALFYSGIIVFLTLVLSSLAIVLVMPPKTLNLISGLNEAFQLFLNNFHLQGLMPILIIMMIIGGFGGMAAWVIGPTKGLVVAAEDGLIPAALGYRNAKGAPTAVLLLQAIVMVALCSLFLIFKSISTSYWILSIMTGQLALIFYVCLFAAAIKLRYKTAFNPQAFRIPGGKFGIWLTGGVGILACLGAIGIGFVPPADVVIGNVYVYESILIVGILVLLGIPLWIHKKRVRHLATNSING